MSQFFISTIFIGLLLIIISLIWVMYDKKKSENYIDQMEEKKDELKNTIEEAEEMILEMNRFSDYLVSQINSNNKQLKSKLNEINKDTEAKNISINDEENTVMDKLIDREKADGYTEHRAEVRVEDRLENMEEIKTDAKAENSTIENDANIKPEKAEHYADFKAADKINKDENIEKFELAEKVDTTDNIEVNASSFDAVRLDLNSDSFQENNVYTIKDIVKNAKKHTVQNTTENRAQNAVSLNFKHREVLKLATEGLSDTEIAKRMNIGKGEVQLILGMNR